MKKWLVLLAVVLLTGCSPGDPITQLNEPMYFKGNVWTWNGTAYQLVNTNLGGNSTSNVTLPILWNDIDFTSGLQPNINQIVVRSHSSLSQIGTNSHATIDQFIIDTGTNLTAKQDTIYGAIKWFQRIAQDGK